MSELLYNKSKAVEELNKVEGFYPLELARVISNEGQEEQRYLDVKYRKLWFVQQIHSLGINFLKWQKLRQLGELWQMRGMACNLLM